MAWTGFGVVVILQPPQVDQVGADPEFWERPHVGLEVWVIAGGAAYAAAIFSTTQKSARARLILDGGIRLAYAIAAVLFVLGIVYPAERMNDYFFGFDNPGSLSRAGFWVFAACWIAALLVFTVMWTVNWQ